MKQEKNIKIDIEIAYFVEQFRIKKGVKRRLISEQGDEILSAFIPFPQAFGYRNDRHEVSSTIANALVQEIYYGAIPWQTLNPNTVRERFKYALVQPPQGSAGGAIEEHANKITEQDPNQLKLEL